MRAKLLQFLVAIVAVAIGAVAAIGGCDGGHKAPAPNLITRPTFRTLPPPAFPHGFVVGCPAGDNHVKGQCLPHLPSSGASHARVTGIRAVDTSNNDPIYGDAAWRTIYAHGFRIAEFKVNEGTGFIDTTAKAQADSAKRAGLIVTGYDFAHLCAGDGSAEGHMFAKWMIADGLTGPRTLPGDLDMEYQPAGTSCNTRAWAENWYAAVKHDLGRDADTYTGAWFWQPHLGSYWHGGCCSSTNKSWISGYGVSWPFMPSGRTKLDIWQDSDKFCNGVSCVDASLWLDGQAELERSAQVLVPRTHCFGPSWDHTAAVCKKIRPEMARRSREIVSVDALGSKRFGCWKPYPTPGPNFTASYCKPLEQIDTVDRAWVKANLY